VTFRADHLGLTPVHANRVLNFPMSRRAQRPATRLRYEATSVPGVFVAGNIIKDVQLSIVAAAEGARAAFGINRSLTREDFERHATGVQCIEHPSMQRPPIQLAR
jgi:pyruvate/2-oxoglutarate dehydrogenase complex dihydrolipoamide dehydrogenase (E3) component